MIVIALFTALLAPYFVDWSSFKEDFEREASRIIGQNVEVLGETNVRILPLPSVVFGGLAIGKNADGSPLMTVDQFNMDIELMPMLKGEVSIVELNLVRPRVNLVVDENGAIAWTNRHEMVVDPERITLENFNVTNGEIKIHGLAGGRTLSLEQLDGRISAKSLYGPWRVDADGYIGDKRANIDISTGHLQEDGSIRIRIGARQSELPYKLTLDGSVKVDKGVLRWDGDFQVSAHKADSKGKTALPIFVTGKFDATPRFIDVPEFHLEVGERADPYTITGTGSAHISDEIKFEIKADGRQIDLDRMSVTNGQTQDAKNLSLEHRLNVLRDLVAQIPLPPVAGVIDLSLPAIVAGDTVIREVSTVFSPDGAGWKIHKLNAVFPGNTKLEARGKVGLGEAFGFTGNMLVASRQPTGLAAWLGKRNNPFVRKLRSLGFSADVVISENQTSLENLEMLLGNARLNGKLQRLSGSSGPPAIIARLEGETINLDDLRALLALMADEDAQAISNHDLDINLSAGKLTGFDISANDVEARFRFSNGVLSIEKLSASDFFGAKFTSEGRVENLLKRPNGNFKLGIAATQAKSLLRFVRQRLVSGAKGKAFLDNLIGNETLLEDLDLALEFNSRSPKEVSVGALTLRGQVGASVIDASVGFSGKAEALDAAMLDISVALSNDNPLQLLQQLNLPVQLHNVDGPLKISGNFTGKLREGLDSFVSAQMTGNGASAKGMVFALGKNDAQMKVTFTSKDIDPLLKLAGLNISSGALKKRDIAALFSGDVHYQENKISISNGEGQIEGNEFDIEMEIYKPAAANNRVTGSLNIDRIDLPFLSALALNSESVLEPENAKGWNMRNFREAILAGVDGKIALKIGQSAVGSKHQATNITATLAMIDGSIDLKGIKGQWLDTDFDANLSLTNAQGIGSLSAQFSINNLVAQNVLDELALPNSINAKANISGRFEGSGRSNAAIVASLAGSGNLELSDVTILNFNTQPLKNVFTAADQRGFKILDKNVLPIIEAVIDKGEAAGGEISIPFIMAAGKIQVRNIVIDTSNAHLQVETEIDLAKGEIVGQIATRFDPGIEWVDGAQPLIIMSWSGDMRNPTRSIDVQPLSGYLSLRNFEREQRSVDLLQAAILEKQRLRRDVVVTNARIRHRQRTREKQLFQRRQAILEKEEVWLRKMAAIRHLELLELERTQKANEKLAAQVLEQKRLAALEKQRLAEQARLALEAKAKLEREETERLRLVLEAEQAAQAERLRFEAANKAEIDRLIAEEKLKAAELERAQRNSQANSINRVVPPASGTDNVETGRQLLNDGNFAKQLNEFLSNP